MATITNFFRAIWKYRNILIIVLLVILSAITLQQCNKAKQAEQESKTAKHIASQNLAALKDSTIQLRLTRDQLKDVDTQLSVAVDKMDSIIKTKSRVVTKTEFFYVPTVVTTESDLNYDSSRKSYGLSFKSIDQVRTIGGTSYFKMVKIGDSLSLAADSTKITDFSLNFSLVCSEYLDPVTKFTKVKIVPFELNPDNTLGNPIPETVLKLKFRNVELLEKPFTPNTPIDVKPAKRKIHTGWAVTVNPLAVGLYSYKGDVRYGWTPNIGFGYYITIRK